jgi:uncharacterized protein YndB with AHSA1/START domain
MIEHSDDGYWMTLEEEIAAHHDEVFAALTTAGGLMRWFCVAAEVELRSGGLIVFGWDPKMERKSTVAILGYDPGGRIVWDWYAKASETHAPVYWTVEPSVEKGSKVTLRQGPFAGDTETLLAMADEGQTWRWHLCNLRCVFEARHDMRKVRPL